MNREELLQELTFLFDGTDAVGLSMYLILKTADGFVAKQADIDERTVEPKLKEQFLAYINSEIRNNADLNVADLATADNRNNTIYSYNFDEKPEGLEVMSDLIENEQREAFNFVNDDFNSIYGFVFLIGSERNKIALYKKHYPINLIKRDSFFIFQADTRLVEANEEIIRINETIDFIQIEEEIIVLNVNTLERYFKFDNIIKNKAVNNITTIEGSNLLEDTALLRQLATNVRYAKKLMKVKSNSAVFNLDFPRVRDFIRHHPKLEGKMRFNFSGTRIALDTKTSAELFLKLLDDDFLRSELTDFLYESDTKNLLRLPDADIE